MNALENPSPAIGWHNEERAAFYDRIKGDVVFALALVHHLAIALNIPLPFIADWLASLCKYLLIEFVPKSDEKVQLLLENREDIFDDYSISNFEQTFSNRFEILTKAVVPGSPRTLYLMKRINETA